MRRRHVRRVDRRGERCLNCEAAIERAHRYCPHCGQENVDVNISLWSICRDAADEYLRVDSKFFRTLVPLVVKPGELTAEWRRGRRSRYVSPLKLYLTITFFFFLIMPFVQRDRVQVVKIQTDPPRVESSSKYASLDLIDQTANEAATRALPDRGGSAHSTGFDALDKLQALAHDPSGRLRQAFLNELIAHVPTAIFLMLPVFAGFVWILYLRHERYYVEHLVFALHCHAFYFLLLLVVSLLPGGKVATDIGGTAVLVGAPVYSVAALKRTYDQGWFKTLIKSGMLAFAYFILLGFALLGAVLVAASQLPTT